MLPGRKQRTWGWPSSQIPRAKSVESGRPDCCGTGAVGFGDQGIIGDVDPFAVDLHAVVTLARSPVDISLFSYRSSLRSGRPADSAVIGWKDAVVDRASFADQTRSLELGPRDKSDHFTHACSKASIGGLFTQLDAKRMPNQPVSPGICCARISVSLRGIQVRLRAGTAWNPRRQRALPRQRRNHF
jgi:hypothetical protein